MSGFSRASPRLAGARAQVVVVEFCPHNESADRSMHTSKFHLAANSTFEALLKTAAEFYYSDKDLEDVVLRDANNAIWPLRKCVSDELRPGEVIRLTPADDDDTTASESTEEAEEVADEVEVDELRTVQARPPLYRELFLHFIFLTLLFSVTYSSREFGVNYQLTGAIEERFLSPRSENAASCHKSFETREEIEACQRARPPAADDFHNVHTVPGVCVWLANRLPWALTDDYHDPATGSIDQFNRLAGGITFDLRYQEWQSSDEAKVARRPYNPLWGSGFTPTREVVGYVTPHDLTSVFESLNPGGSCINETAAADANGPRLKDTPECHLSQFAYITDRQVYEAINATCSLGSNVFRSLSVRLLLYNRNHDVFVLSQFNFDRRYSGRVRATASLQPFRFEHVWGDLHLGIHDRLKRVGLWLTGALYLLVLIRTVNEVRAGRQVRQTYGSVMPYFTSIYTVLELFNLACNYTALALNVAQLYAIDIANPAPGNISAAAQPVTTNFEDDVQRVAEMARVLEIIRASSILSASLLLFKYLELAPKNYLPAFFLTGTTLSRAGRHIQFITFWLLFIIAGFAVAGEVLFGDTVPQLSSFPAAFYALIRTVSGDGILIRPLIANFPGWGTAYFVVFFLSTLLVILPLYLASVNDAYAFRDGQMRRQAERRAERRGGAQGEHG